MGLPTASRVAYDSAEPIPILAARNKVGSNCTRSISSWEASSDDSLHYGLLNYELLESGLSG